MAHTLTVSSPAFSEGSRIPRRHTARGQDLSPRLEPDGIDPGAQSIAITLDDASHPLFPGYNHWVIWNLPVQSVIPEAIPHGKTLGDLGGATQGIAYGRHRYKGPKPPFRAVHTYVFTVYILDCRCALPPKSRKRDLLAAIQGHILKQAALSGTFRSRGE